MRADTRARPVPSAWPAPGGDRPRGCRGGGRGRRRPAGSAGGVPRGSGGALTRVHDHVLAVLDLDDDALVEKGIPVAVELHPAERRLDVDPRERVADALPG